MNKYLYSWIYLLVLLLPFSCIATAQTEDAERSALSRLSRELALTMIIVDEAERNQPKNPEYSFRYSSLRTDIDKIIKGIETHLNRPNRVPKNIAPLFGAYSD